MEVGTRQMYWDNQRFKARGERKEFWYRSSFSFVVQHSGTITAQRQLVISAPAIGRETERSKTMGRLYCRPFHNVMRHFPRVRNGWHFGHKFSGFVAGSGSMQETEAGLDNHRAEEECWKQQHSQCIFIGGLWETALPVYAVANVSNTASAYHRSALCSEHGRLLLWGGGLLILCEWASNWGILCFIQTGGCISAPKIHRSSS